MSITAYENLISAAERRDLKSGAEHTTVRLSDFMGIIPAITGKVELVYEGEQEGAAEVAQSLISDAVKTLFADYFPKIGKLEKEGAEGPYTPLTDWFSNEPAVELPDDCTDVEYAATLNEITPLKALIAHYQPGVADEDRLFLMEFLLWGLVEYNKLSKDRFTEGYQFSDLFGGMMKKL
jgi:magnesium chelatase subunit I